MTNPTFLKILALFLLLLAATWSVDAAEITVKSRVASRGSVVLLGDLANVQGGPQEQPLVADLKRLELFPAPSPGKTRLLRRTELRELVQLHGIDASQHQFVGATRTRIEPPRRPPVITAPSGKHPPTPATKVEEVPRQQLVVAVGDLPRGTILQAHHLQLRTSAQPRGRERGVRDIQLVLGRELTRSIQGGEPLEANWLRRPTLVKRGEVVTVIARAAGVLVKTTAKAQDNGALGDVILLQTLEGGHRFPARVSGRQRAEIYASGTLVSDPPDSGRPALSKSRRGNAGSTISGPVRTRITDGLPRIPGTNNGSSLPRPARLTERPSQ